MHKGYRRDGFTPERKRAAVEGLEKYGTIADAARKAGVSTTTFYRHLAKDPAFAARCETAREKAAAPLEAIAWERAVKGAPETIIRDGKVVQVKVKPSDAMLRMLLQGANPKKYGRMSRGGATRRQIEKKVPREIEAEMGRGVRPRVASNEEVEQALVKSLAAFSRRVRAKGEGGTE
jgi:AcrR family transcriptional regulator